LALVTIARSCVCAVDEDEPAIKIVAAIIPMMMVFFICFVVLFCGGANAA